MQTSKKKFDANKITILNSGSYPYIVRTSDNNGQRGFIDEDIQYLNDGNTISFGQDTATIYYQKRPYFTGDKIKILKPKISMFNKSNAHFFLVAMSQAFKSFSWGASSFNVNTIENQTMLLPMKNGEIDFDFMESFITELEAERIKKLDAYLSISGLKDTELTADEKKVLEDLSRGKIQFAPFSYDSVFENIKQGRRLKKDDQIKGNIPFVMAGVTNSGVVGYISNPVASFRKNSITIDIFGNTFYRNYDFGAGDDTGVYWSEKNQYSKETMLFFSAAMAKSIKGTSKNLV